MKKVTYLNLASGKHQPVTLEKVVSLLKAEKMPKMIRQLRDHVLYLGPDDSPADTERIPVILFSSTYRDSKWEGYTGLILLEFNRLSSFQEACELRDRINRYRTPLLVFVGSSGRSVKVIVPYTLPEGQLLRTREEAELFHAHAYLRAALHYEELLNRKIEQKKPSLNQGCHVSWDPDCFFHPDSLPFILEQPDALPEPKEIRIQGENGYDPLAGILPGMEQIERINILYENCLSRTLDEEGTTWSNEDEHSFIQVIAGYCYRSAIPEETAVRRIYRRRFLRDSIDLIRLTVRNVYRQQKKPAGWKPVMPKYMHLIIRIEEFMQRRYELRYNELTEEPEYRENHIYSFYFKPVTIEVMHDMCMNAQKEGIPVLDPDIKRYIISNRLPRYNPLSDFLQNLPTWDGQDRIRALAATVPTLDPLWPDHFYIWFLSMVTHWIKKDRTYGNSLVPVLTGGQGFSKSVFFRRLLPPSLQNYYAENINPENKTQTELQMAQNLLINIDEFDRISMRHQAELKRLIQTPELKIRKPHQRTFRITRRMCSFCATANPAELLTDPSGSRRFICVRLTGPVDVSHAPDYEQLYAQAKEAIFRKERYWLTPEEEARLIESNQQFQQVPLEIQYTLLYFRKPEEGEKPELYRAAHLLDLVARKAKRTFSKTTEKQYSEWLAAQGFVKRHTHYGNVFEVIEI